MVSVQVCVRTCEGATSTHASKTRKREASLTSETLQIRGPNSQRHRPTPRAFARKDGLCLLKQEPSHPLALFTNPSYRSANHHRPNRPLSNLPPASTSTFAPGSPPSNPAANLTHAPLLHQPSFYLHFPHMPETAPVYLSMYRAVPVMSMAPASCARESRCSCCEVPTFLKSCEAKPQRPSKFGLRAWGWLESGRKYIGWRVV